MSEFLRKASGSLPGRKKRAVRKSIHRRTRQLLLEGLEERTLLAVRIWDGGGGDANWSTAANWVGDIAPLAGDDLVFAAGAARAANANDLAAGTRFNTILIHRGGYTITGNAIELYGGLTANNVSGHQHVRPRHHAGQRPDVHERQRRLDAESDRQHQHRQHRRQLLLRHGPGPDLRRRRHDQRHRRDRRRGQPQQARRRHRRSWAATTPTKASPRRAGLHPRHAQQRPGVRDRRATPRFRPARRSSCPASPQPSTSPSAKAASASAMAPTLVARCTARRRRDDQHRHRQRRADRRQQPDRRRCRQHTDHQRAGRWSRGSRATPTALSRSVPARFSSRDPAPTSLRGDTRRASGHSGADKTGAGSDNAIGGNLIIGDNIGGDNAATVRLLADDQIPQLNFFDVALNTDHAEQLGRPRPQRLQRHDRQPDPDHRDAPTVPT